MYRVTRRQAMMYSIPKEDRLSQAIAAVKRGAALLDAKGPADWRSKVDPETVDMRSRRMCPLGQIYGSDSVGFRELGLPPADDKPESVNEHVEHGFDTFGNWREVEQCWAKVIRGEVL